MVTEFRIVNTEGKVVGTGEIDKGRYRAFSDALIGGTDEFDDLETMLKACEGFAIQPMMLMTKDFFRGELPTEARNYFEITITNGWIRLAITDYRGTRDWTLTARGPAELLNLIGQERLMMGGDAINWLTRFSEQGWQVIKHLSKNTGGWAGSTDAAKVGAIQDLVDADLQEAVKCLLLNQ